VKAGLGERALGEQPELVGVQRSEGARMEASGPVGKGGGLGRT
jgi:hypothetical protein